MAIKSCFCLMSLRGRTLDTERATQVMGVPAYRAKQVGDAKAWHPVTREPARWHSEANWMINSSHHVQSIAMEAHCEFIARLLEPALLGQIPGIGNIELQLDVISDDAQSDSFSITPQLIAALGKLTVPYCVDIVFHCWPDDEPVEKLS